MTAAALLTLLFTGAAAAGDISIELENGVFRVAGWVAGAEPPQGWVSVFPVYAGASDDQPLLGSYAVVEHALTFRPRFPITAGVHYRAAFIAVGKHIDAAFEGPARAADPLTRVQRIYPSADLLPSNTLRFYVYFSAPMSRGEAWEHIHLIDEDRHEAVQIPFLELEQELWDANNQRLTVLFDPGRIKRGLVPTNTIGPAVVEGRHYKLVIDREWHDARGVRLVEGFEKAFRGGPADLTPPEPKTWRITAPKSGSNGPLLIEFPKSMDFVLLQRMISISDGRAEIAGSISVDRNETQWSFTPREAWKSGAYRITAENTLEDISGNHLDRPFDVDVFEKVTRHIETTTSSIPFTVR